MADTWNRLPHIVASSPNVHIFCLLILDEGIIVPLSSIFPSRPRHRPPAPAIGWGLFCIASFKAVFCFYNAFFMFRTFFHAHVFMTCVCVINSFLKISIEQSITLRKKYIPVTRNGNNNY